MDIKKLERKQVSLKNIYTLVSSKRDIALIKIFKLSKRFEYFYKRAINSKTLLDILHKKFNLKNPFYEESSLLANNKLINLTLDKVENMFFVSKKRLWIYVTETQNAAADNYSRYDRAILKQENVKEDQFITIGEHAKNFCLKNKLEVVKHYPENDYDELSKMIPEIIRLKIESGDIIDINFVINSNKIKNKFLKILPIKHFELDTSYYEKADTIVENIEKYKLYNNLQEFIVNEINSYLRNVVTSLLVESSLIVAKNNLVKYNKTISDLDETLLNLRREILKQKRELEIQELQMLTRSNESMINMESKKDGDMD
ncbi:hypothetical protein RUS47_03550 [Mycoplasmoides gallisepticum]|uniref:ATP synthase gamma chain n=1 Tax=Mycoplasmoides gallisepticum WI01_2001.043-13-2P TaxID=1159201 RepID=J3VHJ2_MYCGL|nr:hypothetical protein [Mycoplasmoides gallisepticum]AFP76983.1 hypothetical protein HFMG95NCA_4970 [Mycoplasmoides gallisepticum NC95_13295-2-2P]AFP77741.1 hypothetical protein HFMG96NCA_5161 [Mycoplasmoides gallisepticum NC96_1596-4-2P]AFP78508.1 hypothetical protein HFMG01NYA_5034 [Mycoplasmoides gallisepticum NY01_2001.047-5-1P]AFP79268.1 hypothetical protein HFMG01WIA_4889 [Mycoplasmoides gallisepticum WI01_2001.043-13-2P]AFP80014.1 hypothetical protein HFMG06NCA_4946 [Mycoplasmoides gal